jgi:hypothetical protein
MKKFGGVVVEGDCIKDLREEEVARGGGDMLLRILRTTAPRVGGPLWGERGKGWQETYGQHIRRASCAQEREHDRRFLTLRKWTSAFTFLSSSC